jgi:Ferritin-like domain
MANAFGRFLATTTQLAPFFKNDLEVVNYALTLEHLEATFYKMVVSGGKLQGNALKYLTVIRDHEVAHVDALTKAIQSAGGTPVKVRQSYNFAALGDMNTQDGILKIAEILEMTGVGAYNGAAREISDKTYLGVAGSIVAIEARHTAIVRALINPNANPVPKGFEAVTKPQDVLNAVGPLLGPES